MENKKSQSIKGRGAADNPACRFDAIVPEKYEEDVPDPEGPAPGTRLIPSPARSIISKNDSPDVGMDASINVYRGCEHGCSYCYSRPTHEYFGMSAGLDFESKILVKTDAPALLRKELSSPKWTPKVIAMSGVTDCYQPAEKKLRLTRACLEVLHEFRNPVLIITKNHLVTRDVDILAKMARHGYAAVILSVTSLDAKLSRLMEPRTSSPQMRLDAIRCLTDAGVPAGVNVAPVVPGLTDHEMPAILKAAAQAGAIHAGYVPLRLPHGVKELFSDWLQRNFPGRKEKVLNRIRDIRGGKLNDPDFNSRMQGTGIYAEQISALFEAGTRQHGLNQKPFGLSTAAFRRTGNDLFS